jgi:hypothetical protein
VIGRRFGSAPELALIRASFVPVKWEQKQGRRPACEGYFGVLNF